MPQEFRVEFIPIFPKGGLSRFIGGPQRKQKAFLLAAKTYLNSVAGPQLKRDYKATVRGWNTTVRFSITKAIGGFEVGIVVAPNIGTLGGRIWSAIDEGTDDRPIQASTPAGLRYQRNYSAKTFGGSGSKSGAWVRRRIVPRWSIRPRNFTQRIAADNEDDIFFAIQRIFDSIY